MPHERNKVEFGSPEWMRALREEIPAVISKHPEVAAITFTLCEVLRNVPEHLDIDGSRLIAWHYRMADGTVRFMPGRVVDADVTIICDYEVMLPLARRIHAGDDEAQAWQADIVKKAISEERMRIDGDPAVIPPFFATLHDRIAARTR